MNEIERAIDYLCRWLPSWKTHNENGAHHVEVALAALREKQGRKSGCEWCADNYDHRRKTMFRKGSDWNYEAKYCDMCGKRLEEHHEAD